MATLSTLYSLAGRQTEGFLASIFSLMGVDLPVPDHTTLSLRLGKLNIDIPVMPAKEAIHLVVDSLKCQSLWRRRVENKNSWSR